MRKTKLSPTKCHWSSNLPPTNSGIAPLSAFNGQKKIELEKVKKFPRCQKNCRQKCLLMHYIINSKIFPHILLSSFTFIESPCASAATKNRQIAYGNGACIWRQLKRDVFCLFLFIYFIIYQWHTHTHAPPHNCCHQLTMLFLLLLLPASVRRQNCHHLLLAVQQQFVLHNNEKQQFNSTKWVEKGAVTFDLYSSSNSWRRRRWNERHWGKKINIFFCIDLPQKK